MSSHDPARAAKRLALRLATAGTLAILATLLSSALVAQDKAKNQVKSPKTLIRQAQKLTHNGDLPGAETMLRRAMELDKSRSDAAVELAYVLTKERRLGDAYELAYPIAKAEPRNAHVFAVLGAALLSGGRFKDARLLLYNAVNINKREDLAWAGIGMLDFYENDIENSLAMLRTAVSYAPSEPDYLFALAQVSARAELYQEAAEAYQDFLSVARDSDADRRERIRGLIEFLRYLGNTSNLYSPNGVDHTHLKFELVGNRPIVTVRLNGNPQPLRFVIDTGSGISVISETTAKRLGIKPVAKGGFAKGLGGDGKFAIVYGLVKQFDLGEVSLRNVPIYIRKFSSDTREVDGYVGLSLISKFLTTIDYGDNTFSLTKKSDDTKAFNSKSAMALPLRLTSSGFLSGEVQLDGVGEPLNFIVDTGASVSVISNQVAQTDGVSRHLRDEKLRVIGSAGLTGDLPTFLLPKVSFGQYSSHEITAVAVDLGIINEASGFEQSGILGGNFLKNYRLTFDFKNARVVFDSVTPERDPANPERY